MSDPQAAFILKGQYQPDSATKAAAEDMRAWSQSIKGDVDEAKKSIEGFKAGFDLARDAMGGFGAVALARDVAGVAESAAQAALGLGEFVVQADRAGASIHAGILADARALKDEVDGLRRTFLGVGSDMAGPFLDPMRESVQEFRGWVDENRETVRQFAIMAKDVGLAAAEGVAGAIEPVVAPIRAAWAIMKAAGKVAGEFGEFQADTQSAFYGKGASMKKLDRARDLDSARELGTLTDADRRVAEEMAREAALEAERAQAAAMRDQQRHQAELAREQQHMEAKRLQEQMAYDQAFGTDLAREQAEDLRKSMRAEQARMQFAVSEQDKLLSIELWQDQQLALVAGHEDAETMIRAEGERRREAIRKGFRDQERNQEVTRFREKMAREQAAHQGILGLAGAAGVKQHVLQKAQYLSQAIMALNAAKMKALAVGGPLTGAALIAAVVGIATPIISALRSSAPDSGSLGASGGGGGGGAVSLPTFSAPLAIPTSSPQAPVAAVTRPNIDVYVNIKGSVLTEDKIANGVMDAIEVASRDGRSTIMTRKQ